MPVFRLPIFMNVFIMPFFAMAQLENLSLTSTDDAVPLKTGYFVDSRLLYDNYFYFQSVKQFFIPAKKENSFQITSEYLKAFDPLIFSLENYILTEKKGSMINCESRGKDCTRSFTQVNGLSENELALEIIKSSYCFGTDPFMVASKIRQESRFDMSAVSDTGAVGLTQMTYSGIAEILDQLGHRGHRYAYVENRDFIINAIECYVRKPLSYVLSDFPQVGTYSNKKDKNEIYYSPESMRALRSWILPPKTALKTSNKKAIIQRQLFMGQILLKIYLAYSQKVSSRRSTLQVYGSALRMFNGDDIQVSYAKEIIKSSKTLDPQSL